MHDTTRSTRYRVSCAISPQRIRIKSPSFPSAIVAREERCSRLRFQPHPSRRALLELGLALAMGHTTKILRSSLTGRKGRREALIHVVGSSLRAHSTLERSVTSFALLVWGTGFTLFASGLLPRPRCTSHTPSLLTRQRSSLSPVYSSCMYVCQFAARRSMLMRRHRISILFRLRTQMDMCIHGKMTGFGAPISSFVSFYLWLKFIAGTRIACNLVLNLVA